MPDPSALAEVKILADAQALAAYAAERLIQLAAAAIRSSGRFCVALSGGSTPRQMYTLLAQAERREQIDWSRLHIFWGDERCVPPDHPDSNYRMARQALLNQLPIPIRNIHRMPGELEPEVAARRYEAELRAAFPGQSLPRFDLALLGLGDDGHTASLFPGSLALAETERWTVAVPHTAPPPPLVSRLSLTLPALNAAANLFFLVSGAGKAAILGRVLQPIHACQPLPAQLVRPANGCLTWLVDEAAAIAAPIAARPVIG